MAKISKTKTEVEQLRRQVQDLTEENEALRAQLEHPEPPPATSGRGRKAGDK